MNSQPLQCLCSQVFPVPSPSPWAGAQMRMPQSCILEPCCAPRHLRAHPSPAGTPCHDKGHCLQGSFPSLCFFFKYAVPPPLNFSRDHKQDLCSKNNRALPATDIPPKNRWKNLSSSITIKVRTPSNFYFPGRIKRCKRSL